EISLHEAERAIDLPRRLGWTAGVVLFQDILLVDAIEDNENLRSRLVTLLRPLLLLDQWKRRGDFLGTLEAFYACGLSRAATAEFLKVHPHTIDYRLSRVESLLGMPVRDSASVMLLQGALAAYHFQTNR